MIAFVRPLVGLLIIILGLPVCKIVLVESVTSVGYPGCAVCGPLVSRLILDKLRGAKLGPVRLLVRFGFKVSLQ
jgi:hypothetical protein